MDVPSTFGIISVVVLVLANGFFVASEFSMVSVRRSRLEQLEASGNASARTALRHLERIDRYIAATQLCITMASLALGWVGEPALAHLLEPPFEATFGHFAPAASNGIAIALTFVLITTLHIVFGEQVPKLLGIQRSERVLLFVARPMQIVTTLLRFPISILSGLARMVLKLFGLKPSAAHEMVHSVEELRLLVTGSQQAGEVEASEARIATRAFVFADRTAGELMTPRTELEAVPVDIRLPELLKVVRSARHSRLPVFEGSIDNIVGVLHVHDLFDVLDQPPDSFDLRRLTREALAVPYSKDADDLLDEMRAQRRQLAVVLDEYGGTAGVVTIEDLVEALVGRIEDELPDGEGIADGAAAESDERPLHVGAADTVTTLETAPASDGSLAMDGLTRLWEFEELTGLKLPESDYEDADTVGGLVMAHLGRIPEPGDQVQISGRTLRVEELDGRRVAMVRLLPTGVGTPDH